VKFREGISKRLVVQGGLVKLSLIFFYFKGADIYLIYGETSQDPPELPAVLKYPLIFKNSQFNPLNFQLLSIWTHPYKLGHKIFQKDQNTPNFYLKKKIGR
jgi:hypothetical protein